ncbi:MAG: HEAT repeat domain-containing protein [Planctomycetes bacterium]|nr:HEAT repeat domain-containing protein [Planctomycetota bacterium]
MPRQLSAAVAIALSIAALLAVIAQSRSNTGREDGGASAEDLRAMKEELGSLGASIRALRSRVDSMNIPGATAGEPDAAVSGRLDGLRQELDRIAKRLADIEAKLDSKIAEPSVPAQVDDTASLRTQINDAAIAPQDRIRALVMLRTKSPDERGAVVDSMAALLEACDDADVRASVIRNMHGIDSPRLKQAVLQALARDGEARVREQAAKDLDTWRNDPEVKAALESARLSDPSDKVRRRAEETLSKD